MAKGDTPIPLDDEAREVIRLLQAAAERAKNLILHPPGKTDKSRSWHASQAAARLAQINRQLDQVKAKLVSVTGKKITAAYREGINQAEQQAIDAGIRPAGGVIQGGFTAVDRRRATVLIQQTAKDLSQAVDSIKATTGKIAKQTQALGLDAKDVNRLLAGGTLDGQPKATLRELKKLIVKAAIDGKIVTVNRNTGEARSFKPDYYAEMVFQTKLAETTNVATIQRLRDKKILYVKIIGSNSRNFCTAFVGRVFYIGDGNDPKYGFPSIRQLPRGGPPFHPRCTKRYTAFIPALQGEEAIEKARLKPHEQELLNKPSSEAQKVFEASQKKSQPPQSFPATRHNAAPAFASGGSWPSQSDGRSLPKRNTPDADSPFAKELQAFRGADDVIDFVKSRSDTTFTDLSHIFNGSISRAMIDPPHERAIELSGYSSEQIARFNEQVGRVVSSILSWTPDADRFRLRADPLPLRSKDRPDSVVTPRGLFVMRLHLQSRQTEAAHEAGHLLETDPIRLAAARSFLTHRVGKEVSINMREVFGTRYEDSETGRGDKFLELFPGKPHRGYYAGKDYPDQQNTEVLSMGLQLMFERPGDFLRIDPEYFKFVVRVLRRQL